MKENPDPNRLRIIEVNAHTGERREHTAESFRNRLAALRLPAPDRIPQQGWAAEGSGCWFRIAHPGEERYPQALESGAWGMEENRRKA